MAEVNTTRDQRGYKLGCLPFLLIVIILIILAVILLLWLTGSHAYSTKFDFFDFDYFKRILHVSFMNNALFRFL